MAAGKPQNQALAIAYSVKRKAQHKSRGGEVQNKKLHPMADGGMVDPHDDLVHDQHEDFLTESDPEDNYNDLPEDEPTDVHEMITSEPPGNTDGGAEEESLLAQLMRRRRLTR